MDSHPPPGPRGRPIGTRQRPGPDEEAGSLEAQRGPSVWIKTRMHVECSEI